MIIYETCMSLYVSYLVQIKYVHVVWCIDSSEIYSVKCFSEKKWEEKNKHLETQMPSGIAAGLILRIDSITVRHHLDAWRDVVGMAKPHGSSKHRF